MQLSRRSRVDEDGRADEHGGRQQFSFSSPHYRTSHAVSPKSSRTTTDTIPTSSAGRSTMKSGRLRSTPKPWTSSTLAAAPYQSVTASIALDDRLLEPDLRRLRPGPDALEDENPGCCSTGRTLSPPPGRAMSTTRYSSSATCRRTAIHHHQHHPLGRWLRSLRRASALDLAAGTSTSRTAAMMARPGGPT